MSTSTSHQALTDKSISERHELGSRRFSVFGTEVSMDEQCKGKIRALLWSSYKGGYE
jgi:hypothetical protein